MEDMLYKELVRLGVHPDSIDAEKLSEEIGIHMERGLSGEEGSMMMIPTFLFSGGSLKIEEPVAVIDAGGTNLRTALVVFRESGAEILEQHRTAMPGTEGPVSTEGMYDRFVETVLPIMPESGKLALCFSYAFQSLPDGEARIITMGKEVMIEGCEGSLVREGMLDAFKRAGYSGIPQITVLNDTAAVLFSALISGSDNAVGFILGTGMNAAYFEKTEDISKISAEPGRYMAVNMEAAYFSDPPMGTVDRLVDEHSRNRGRALLEKMVSGAYLGEIAYRCTLLLAEERLISRESLRSIENAGEFSVRYMTELIENSSGPYAGLCSGSGDIDALREVFLSVERRAGKLTAALVAAVIKKITYETGSTVTVAVNGSTIRLNRNIRGEFEKWLRELLGENGSFTITEREDDTLVGSAAAAFCG